MLNKCRSRYHRDNTLCRDCADARACLACRPAACYSQYERNALQCIQCPLAEYCRASTYCHKRFHAARHGEPQIVLAEIQSAVPEAEQDKYNILSEFAGVILSPDRTGIKADGRKTYGALSVSCNVQILNWTSKNKGTENDKRKSFQKHSETLK